MRDGRPTSRRAVLTTVGAGTAAGLAGCSGLLGGPTYRCMELRVTHAGDRYNFDADIEYHRPGSDERLLRTGSSGRLDEKVIEWPSNCNDARFREEEHDPVQAPIEAEITVHESTDVSADTPLSFSLELDGEQVDSAEVTNAPTTVTLSHEG